LQVVADTLLEAEMLKETKRRQHLLVTQEEARIAAEAADEQVKIRAAQKQARLGGAEQARVAAAKIDEEEAANAATAAGADAKVDAEANALSAAKENAETMESAADAGVDESSMEDVEESKAGTIEASVSVGHGAAGTKLAAVTEAVEEGDDAPTIVTAVTSAAANTAGTAGGATRRRMLEQCSIFYTLHVLQWYFTAQLTTRQRPSLLSFVAHIHLLFSPRLSLPIVAFVDAHIVCLHRPARQQHPINTTQ
jgi:hypothetical protein